MVVIANLPSSSWWLPEQSIFVGEKFESAIAILPSFRLRLHACSLQQRLVAVLS